MTATPALTSALQQRVRVMEDDLRARVDALPDVRARWETEYRDALERGRTAATWESWRDEQVMQAAVAWVLTSVFVRFCEDNGLVDPVWIAGPGERRQEALDARLAYFREHPDHTDREWLQQAVAYLAKLPATAALVDDHSPLHLVSPSGDAAGELLRFWQERGEDGRLVHDLTDATWSTRFLGDLYQDLSKYARDTYALLQTPEFVEEFILDRTLEEALKERPLEGFRLIDPTCGSGHFLLGAFARLMDRWHRHAPDLETRARVQTALDAVHGVDLNPFAVAIARFRLTVAALKECGEPRLEVAPAFRFHLAVGDSLLHGSWQEALDFGAELDPDAAVSGHVYSTEDLHALRAILQPGRYDVVVGNPPYITPKDEALRNEYRKRYREVCKGKYALTVPFMKRFFDLAKPQVGDHPTGWVGQIGSNSFMKREFGVPLIEKFLAKKDIRFVIDTSGAYIPGHGTPTVVVIGRNQEPEGRMIRAVLGIRGEPSRPADAAQGIVWTSIANHFGETAFDNGWITVTNLDRKYLAHHPWSLSGGGATDLLRHLESAGDRPLIGLATAIGITAVTGEDDFFMLAANGSAGRLGWCATRPMVEGDLVRDWGLSGAPPPAAWPYDEAYVVKSLGELDKFGRWLSAYRPALNRRKRFGVPMVHRGLAWYEWQELYTSKLRTPLSIGFAFVATHNHFVLDRGGKVFNRSAPVIKLPEGASEEDHLALLGVLNSSTACFWLKQNSQAKAGSGTGRGIQPEDWMERYEFTGTTLQDFPLPAELPLEWGRVLDSLAQDLGRHAPGAVCAAGVPTRTAFDAARVGHDRIRGRMIAVQEELDWEVYRLYGLVDEDLTYKGDDLPDLALGERAFEIALARRVAAGEEETAWFDRHGSTPVTEIPAHWPAAYRDLVRRRLDLIAGDRSIRLLEKPEYKRRWLLDPWEKRERAALRDWLLDRLEDRTYWFDAHGRPTPRSVAQLADEVARDPEVTGVLMLWVGHPDAPVTAALVTLLDDEAVPYLAAYRYKPSGLRKRGDWKRTWDLQRREDAGEPLEGKIPVPPKYTSADFAKPADWRHRGKLDVPKERFIGYPDAGRDTDPTPLLGWAGWDHAQQALALNLIIQQREAEGWDDQRLVPLVAGLAEVQPWIDQWHTDVDPTYGVSLAAFCAQLLAERMTTLGRTRDDLRNWRPDRTSRGRRARPSGAPS